METMIFYYTGTGNSLWTARTIAGALGNAELVSIPSVKSGHHNFQADSIGLVFPVYIWGIPAPVLNFINTLTDISPDYIFALAVNGGQVAGTLVQLKKKLAGQGLLLSAGFGITMPSNYIPWGGPGPLAEQQKRFREAGEKIARIAEHIRAKEKVPVEKGPLWQRILFSRILYKLSFSKVPLMDAQFLADEKCNQCGICRQVCPAGNITLQEGKPVWNQKCEQCLACLQWCPREAIQYGEKTPAYPRYHHPEIGLQDILKSRNTAAR